MMQTSRSPRTTSSFNYNRHSVRTFALFRHVDVWRHVVVFSVTVALKKWGSNDGCVRATLLRFFVVLVTLVCLFLEKTKMQASIKNSICITNYSGTQQISAKWGPDSRLVLEANLKIMCPRLSRSSILKTQNRVQAKHEYKPGSNSLKYYRSWLFFPKIRVHLCLHLQPPIRRDIRTQIIPNEWVFFQ